VKLGNERFEVSTAVLLKIQLIWDFQLCRRVKRSRRFEGFYCFLLHSVDEGTRPVGTSEASQRTDCSDHKRSLEIRVRDVEWAFLAHFKYFLLSTHTHSTIRIMVTNSVTPCDRLRLKNLTVAQLIKTIHQRLWKQRVNSNVPKSLPLDNSLDCLTLEGGTDMFRNVGQSTLRNIPVQRRSSLRYTKWATKK